jgi:hypothetical protein
MYLGLVSGILHILPLEGKSLTFQPSLNNLVSGQRGI